MKFFDINGIISGVKREFDMKKTTGKKSNINIISMNKICKSFPVEMGGEQQVLFDITFDVN